MTPRSQAFWELHDFSQGRGLEVGPLNRPIVTTDLAEVHYVDVLDRDGLLRHYAADPDVDETAIPPIDYHLIHADGQTLSLSEATKAGAPFDWVVASHVIEHVPDVIGWLGELAEIVVDGGALVLAVPDKRYCFDVHRPGSTVGQMVAASYAQERRPGVAAVYDYFSSSVSYDVASLWAGIIPPFSKRIHTLEQTQAHVERTLAGEYVDCHVWLFTPESFVRQMQELRVTGRSSWIVERIEPTQFQQLEFQVVMRRLPRDTDTAAPQTGEVLPTGEIPEWMQRVPGREEEALRAQVARLEQRLARRAHKLRRVRRRLRRKQRQLTALEHSRWLLPRRAARALTRKAWRRG